jgi:putative endonuclease
MPKQYYIYILTNHSHSVLYVGITSDLKRRVYEHKNGSGGVFPRKYRVNQLVYYEVFEDVYEAIKREKQLKAGSRDRKLRLIDGMNPEWADLYEVI